MVQYIYFVGSCGSLKRADAGRGRLDFGGADVKQKHEKESGRGQACIKHMYPAPIFKPSSSLHGPLLFHT